MDTLYIIGGFTQNPVYASERPFWEMGAGLRVPGGYHTDNRRLSANGLPCVAGILHRPVNLHWTAVVFLLHKFS